MQWVWDSVFGSSGLKGVEVASFRHRKLSLVRCDFRKPKDAAVRVLATPVWYLLLGILQFFRSASRQVARVDIVIGVESQDSLLLNSVATWFLWMRSISLRLSASHVD